MYFEKGLRYACKAGCCAGAGPSYTQPKDSMFAVLPKSLGYIPQLTSMGEYVFPGLRKADAGSTHYVPSRPFKQAPLEASAQRIRERFLRQLRGHRPRRATHHREGDRDVAASQSHVRSICRRCLGGRPSQVNHHSLDISLVGLCTTLCRLIRWRDKYKLYLN